MDKFRRAEEMIRASAPHGVEILTVEPCPEDDLRRVHSAEYLEKIRTNSLNELAEKREQAFVADTFVIERRQHQDILYTGSQTRLGEAHHVGQCAATGTGHHAPWVDPLGHQVLNQIRPLTHRQ